MGLYLAVFDGDVEVDGVEVGSYSDFGHLRDYLVASMESSHRGSRFPILINHSDSDGEWSIDDCLKLRDELTQIISATKSQPPVSFASSWQINVAKSTGLSPQNAYESFIDVGGEFLLERILKLVDVALGSRLPILFQ